MKTLEVQTVLDMPNDEYRSRPETSRSDASRYRGIYGGRAQRYAEVYGRSLFSGNAATSFGSLVDAAFEAEMSGKDWKSIVAVPPAGVLAADGSRRGKAFTSWRDSLPPGAIETSATDYEKVQWIIDSAKEHRLGGRLLAEAKHSQLSVFWEDDRGHRRKARADGVTDSEWFDIKTTSSPWSSLRHSFREFAYDWQAAWYTDAAVASGMAPFAFRFIVVQVSPPYNTKVLRLTEDDLARARFEINETLNAMRQRRESGEWISDEYHEEQILSLS